MQQPTLTLIAGCNWASKSIYSKLFVEEGIEPFDYAKIYLSKLANLKESEPNNQIAINQTAEELNTKIKEAFQNRNSFCFETNLHVFLYSWIEEAKLKGYLIEMYFFCLDSIQTAKERVYIRTKKNDHNVSDAIIEYKWKEGYKNINLNFKLFDYLSFIYNSANDIPTLLFEILKIDQTHYQFIQLVKQLTKFIERRLPSIFNQLIK